MTFARLIEEGKVNKAKKILEENNKGGILPLSHETFEILQQKHPKASEASNDILLKETPQELQAAVYESINSNGKRCYKKDKRSCRSFRNGR